MARGTVELVDRDREVRLHLHRGLARMTSVERIRFINRMCRLTDRDGTEEHDDKESRKRESMLHEAMEHDLRHALSLRT